MMQDRWLEWGMGLRRWCFRVFSLNFATLSSLASRQAASLGFVNLSIYPLSQQKYSNKWNITIAAALQILSFVNPVDATLSEFVGFCPIVSWKGVF